MRQWTLECKRCEASFVAPSSRRIFCDTCQVERRRERNRNWARKNQESRRAANRDAMRRHIEHVRTVGEERSDSTAFDWHTAPIRLAWRCEVRIPFTWAMSKNSRLRARSRGFVFVPEEVKAADQAIALTVKNAIRMHGVEVKHNRLWIDVLVEKNSHRGDAVNVVDTICDAIKQVVPMDDNWFCIRRVDWRVVKKPPYIYIGFGQEDVPDAQVCSFCGHVLPFDHFHKSRTSSTGHHRTCRGCTKAARERNRGAA